MSLWLAIDTEFSALEVVEALSEAQAMYDFMGMSIYPYRVINLPDILTTREIVQKEWEADALFHALNDG